LLPLTLFFSIAIITKFQVSFSNGSDAHVVENVSFSENPLRGLTDWIKEIWQRLLPVSNYNIYVRGYDGKGIPTTCRLEKLVEQFGSITELSNLVDTFLELSVHIFDYGVGISTIRGKKAFLELKVFTCDDFNDKIVQAVKNAKNVAIDSFRILINDSSNPSFSIRVNKIVDIFQASWHGKFYAVFYLQLHSSYSGLNFVQLQEMMFFQEYNKDDEESIEKFTKLMKENTKGHHNILTTTIDDHLKAPIAEAWLRLRSHLHIYTDAKEIAKKMYSWELFQTTLCRSVSTTRNCVELLLIL
jgi:hypothetical protein